ncbi:protocadherin Fat 4-like [Ptychodera flava]|uniref:protocadherin Fat 4-like n=1 Tax=Ptychodera flava TaxID=63121 RepID=UPI00396A5746
METVDIEIDVFNINDNDPYFEGGPYHVSVDELLTTGTIVLQDFVGTDDDCRVTYIVYEILDGPGSEYFSIPILSRPEVLLKESLDYEEQTNFNLTLVVYDGSPNDDDVRSGTTYLFVNVTDADDLIPIFNVTEYSAVIHENVKDQKLNVSLYAYDQDIEINEPVYYSFSDPERSDDSIFSNEYFELDGDTGEISVISELDREALSDGTITIGLRAAQNNTRGYHIYHYRDAYASLIVTVLDANDNAPNMSSTEYTGEVPEHSPEGTFVCVVMATDIDEGNNAVFEFVVESDFNMFSVDKPTSLTPTTAISYIRVNDSTMLDAERITSVNFTVYAVETLTSQKYESMKADVFVSVLDVNDNSPEFVQDSYTAEVYENITLETSLTTVEANDLDQGKNGDITYSIWSVTDNGGAIFTINETSGELLATNELDTLDADTIDSYIVVVIATDNGDIPRSNLSSVMVTVLNVNDELPEFLGSPYSASISEGALVGASVFGLTAVDADGDNLTYSIVDGHDDMFSINNMTGEVSIAEVLDRESKAQYNISVQVTDGYHQPVESFLVVDVTDINDNNPNITANNMSVKIPEMAMHDITTVQAEDPDAGMNGEISYRIDDRMNEKFNVTSAGLVTTALALDREEQAVHEVYVLAVDHGISPRTGRVVVTVELTDVNDNEPRFEHSTYNATAPEKVIGYHVTTVKAIDLDEGQNAIVKYGIVGGTNHDVFDVDADTGEVRIKKAVSIAGGETLIVHLEAYNDVEYYYDDMINDTTILTVTLMETNATNVYDPQFNATVYPLSTEENDHSGIMGNLVGRVYASDSDIDGEIVTYGFFFGNELQQFNISQGEITVGGTLDRETKSSHILFVYAEDNGFPPRTGYCTVEIEVEDVNDNLPDFGQKLYVATLLEGTSGDVIVKVVATDKDTGVRAQIVYRFNGTGGFYDSFQIDNTTGEITLTEPLHLNGSDVLIDLVVVADNIVPYVGPQTDSNVANVAVTVLATNATNKYDPEFNSTRYQLSADENDYNGVVGELVGRVYASDQDLDGEIVAYGFFFGNENRQFNLSHDGTLSVSGIIDREEQSAFTLVLFTEDNGLPPRKGYTVVEVDVKDANDNPPQFEKKEYNVTVAEGTSGKTVLNVTAIDKDIGTNAEVRYAINSEGAPYDKFEIGAATGEISVVQPLNASETDVFILLEVVAYNDVPYVGPDSPNDTATVLVIVEGPCNKFDPSFNHTTYSFYVDEHVDIGTLVGNVDAHDPDTGFIISIYEIVYGANGKFNISEDGDIRVTGDIDREERDSYKLVIKGTDDGLPNARQSVTQVVVTINDINDNSPEFMKGSSSADIEENSPPGTLIDIEVPEIMITDDDIGSNAHIFVSLTGVGSDNFNISMEEHGFARVRVAEGANLDRETDESFTLTVEAANPDGLNATAQLMISLTDLNDNPPVFEQTNQTFYVNENETVGFYLGSVRAYDDDVDDTNNGVQYFFISGDYGQFAIDRYSGNITVADTLYGNITGRYTYDIVVLAYNSGTNDDLENTTAITVEVGDFYNVAPVFLDSEYRGEIYENASHGDVVLVVLATDINSGPNGDLIYTISTEGDIPFKVDQISGEIRVNGTLDREMEDLYVFDIVATDGGNPPLSAEVAVTIAILDVNDNPPVFLEPSYNATVIDKSPEGLCVIGVSAIDDDINDNAKIEYSLSGNGSEYFKIDKNTGFVQTSKDINSREMLRKGLVEPVGGINGTYVMVINAIATDMGTPSMAGWVPVNITVVETVFEKPVFNETFYEGKVKENLNEDTLVLTVEAQLESEEGSIPIAYSILGGSDEFKISDDGKLTTRVPLDREDRDIYDITVTAYATVSSFPEEHTPITILVSDENDNEPHFNTSFYAFRLFENVPIGTLAGEVAATDIDFGSNAKITYTIESGNIGDTFKLDNTTGALTIGAEVDREERGSYELTIMATDNSEDDPRLNTTVNVTVTILDENDNVPQFTSELYQAQVSEIDPARSNIIEVSADDADEGLNGLVFYRIRDIIYPTSDFYIEEVSGIIRNTRLLTDMGGQLYTLTVEAYNENDLSKINETRVTITIAGAPPDDERLVFERDSYQQTIFVNHTVDLEVVTVNATYGGRESPDTAYNIISEIYEESRQAPPIPTSVFTVDGSSGKITTNTSLSAVGKYTLQVEAYNKTNANKMVTGQYDVTEVVIFVVGYTNGRPTFNQSHYAGFVNDADSQGTLILTIAATDPDAPLFGIGEVTYSFEPGHTWVEDFLDLDASSGALTKGRGDLADFGDDHIIFEVVATDGGVTPLSDVANVTVTVNYTVTNRYTPEVTSSVTEIDEDILVGTAVHVVNATDRDDGSAGVIARYSIEYIGGNTRPTAEKFVIDEMTGEIKTSGTFDFDEDNERYFQLVVSAVDDGEPSKTGFGTLDIYVQDVNDNPPYFTTIYSPFYVLEEQEEASVFVGKVEAYDIDQGDNARIEYTMSGGDGKFMINETTGHIFAVQSLDREKVDRYEVTVNATNSYAERNSHYSDTAFIEIIVEDVNDNAPYFLNEPYERTLLLSAAENHLVLTVETNDIDSGHNAEVSYRLEADDTSSDSTDALKYFKLDETNGELRVAAAFPTVEELEEQEKIFMFTIVAYDNGSPRQVNRSEAVITVRDSSYDEPSFEELPQELWVNMTEHTRSCQELPSTSYNLTDDQEVVYRFAPVCGDEDKFSLNRIDSMTFELCNATDLDREVKDSYVLKIVATVDKNTTVDYNSMPCESGYLLPNELLVHVTILDINDNAPYFLVPVYVTGIHDNTRYGSSILQVEGHDDDVGINQELCYYADQSDESEKFYVDCPNGDIYTRSLFRGHIGQNLPSMSRRGIRLAMVLKEPTIRRQSFTFDGDSVLHNGVSSK